MLPSLTALVAGAPAGGNLPVPWSPFAVWSAVLAALAGTILGTRLRSWP